MLGQMEARVRTMLYVLLVLTVGLASRFFTLEQYEASGASSEYFVSPSGNDGNPGTIDAPFKTIDKARLTARSVGGNVTINLRGGVYELAAPVNLTSADSGKSGGTVTYKSHSNEVAVVRGSKSLTGVNSIGGGAYEVDLNANGLGSLAVKDLFINGARQVPARYPNFIAPNYSASDPWAGNFEFAANNTPAVKNKVIYTDSFTRPTTWNNPTTGWVNIFSGPNYWNSIVPITSIDKTNKTINFGSDVTYDMQPGNRFYVQNIREELDAPGEWFFDAAAKKILLIPPAGSNINNDRISVPVSNYLFNPNGANNIKFSGLILEEAQKHAIYVLNGKDITIEGSILRNTTERGIVVQGSSERVIVNNNIVYNIGDDGIWFDQTDFSYRKNLTPTGHQVVNNRVYQVGQTMKWGYGIKGNNVIGLKIANNEVYDVPRVGIFFSGNDTTVESNHVYNTNRQTQDSSGIYTIGRSWLFRGNVIKNNYVHDTGGYGVSSGAWIYSFFTWGIYLDDFASGNQAFNNLIVRAPKGGFQVHSGRDNSVTNNIVVEASQIDANTFLQGERISNDYYATMWNELANMSANGFDRDKYFARYPQLATITAELNDSNSFAGNVVTKNIFYFPQHPNIRLYWVRNFIGAPGSQSDYNLIWNGGSEPYIGHPESAGGKLSWTQWRGLGYDTHSLLADPLFKDPAHDNYELQANSPALQLGFEPFITSSVGPTTPPPIDPSAADTYNNVAAGSANTESSSSQSAGSSGSGGSKAKKNSTISTAPATNQASEAINLPGVADNSLSLKNQFKILGIKQGSVVVMSILVILLMLCSLAVMFVHKLKIDHLRRIQRSFRALQS